MKSPATLRDRFFSGELLPGTFLDEVQLAEALHGFRARHCVRALKVLTAEGLVRHEAAPRLFCEPGDRAGPGRDLSPVIALLEGALRL